MTTTVLSSIPWNELLAVGIRTTADGPFAEDLFWQFSLHRRYLEVPGSFVEGAVFDELCKRLPGIDHAKLLRACTSVEERVFRIWHHEDSRFSPTTSDLDRRFCALVERLGGDASRARSVFECLHAEWSTDDRRYHGTEHLIDCLRELDHARTAPATADIAELALWYHDIVYEPHERDCEERSAQRLLTDAAALAIPLEVAAAAADSVRATAHANGELTRTTAATDLVLDIDLSILGRDGLRFLDFEYGVEEEYAATSTLAFRVGRGRFLAGLLARPRLFRTDDFASRYEQRARAQVAALLENDRYRSYRWLRWLPCRR